jgi:hypothetical protein
MKDPVEIQLPGRDLLFIVLGMEKTQSRAAVILFDDISLDLCYCSAIGSRQSLMEVFVIRYTHVVNWFIASRTDWLRSSNSFPFVPWSRARQMSAQFSTSST